MSSVEGIFQTFLHEFRLGGTQFGLSNFFQLRLSDNTDER